MSSYEERASNPATRLEKCVTWGDPGGAGVNITPKQEEMMREAGVWPRNRKGEEYAQVRMGAHDDLPTWTDAEVAAFCRGELKL